MFRALAGTGRALEVNTSSPLASVDQVRWFREEGGEAVSFGSDAHQPSGRRPALRPRRRRRRGGRLPAGARPLRLLAPLSVGRPRRHRTTTRRPAPAIYAPVRHRHGASPSSTRAADAGAMAERIAGRSRTHAWLVLEDDGRVVGYAYAGAGQGASRLPLVVRGRACTSSSADGARGGGRLLYEALLRAAGRARLPHRHRRHDAAERGQRGPAPGAGLRAGRHLPADRLEARRVARRRLDAAVTSAPDGRTRRPSQRVSRPPIRPDKYFTAKESAARVARGEPSPPSRRHRPRAATP